jgi:hypothetical protein
VLIIVKASALVNVTFPNVIDGSERLENEVGVSHSVTGNDNRGNSRIDGRIELPNPSIKVIHLNGFKSAGRGKVEVQDHIAKALECSREPQ